MESISQKASRVLDLARRNLRRTRDLGDRLERVSPPVLRLGPRWTRRLAETTLSLLGEEGVPQAEEQREPEKEIGEPTPRRGATVGPYLVERVAGGVAWLRRRERRSPEERRPPAPPSSERDQQAGAPATEPRSSSPSPPRDPARTPELYVRDDGAGPAILLLHAFPLNGRMWEAQVAALRDRARLIVPDLPGCGLSARPQTGLNAKPGAAIDEFASRVRHGLDRLGIDEVAIVGASFGAHVALRLAPLLDGRLRTLVLVGATAEPDAPGTSAELHELAAEIESFGVDAAADAMIPRFLSPATVRARPDLLEQVRSMVRENRPGGLADVLRAMADRPDSRPILSRLGCPVWYVVGDEDLVAPRSDVFAAAGRAPRGHFEVIPRAGHLTSLEAPDRFNDVLLRLLQ